MPNSFSLLEPLGKFDSEAIGLLDLNTLQQ